jgi:hypothetical protein
MPILAGMALDKSVFDRRIEPHDTNQLELKLAYLIRPGERRERYTVETYMFVPRSLGLDQRSYRADDFYADTSAFLRLKTPVVPLSDLAHPERAGSWFKAVTDRLSDRRATAAFRLKVLGCVYRSALREACFAVVDRVHGMASGAEWGSEAAQREVASACERVADQAEAALRRLEGFRDACQAAEVYVRGTWAAVDEYISLVAEINLTRVIEALDDRIRRLPGDGQALRVARQRLAGLAVGLYRHRRESGYESYVEPGEDNERFPYRRRVLKRIVSSALYLDLRHHEGGTLARDAIGMTAAAVAMLFAALVALWGQKNWDVFSPTFLAILVVSYMVKDRIKEWGKQYLGRRARSLMPDHVTRAVDPRTGNVIGVCKEIFEVLEPRRLDPQIQALRHVEHADATAEEGRPEVAVRYAKAILLRSDALEEEMEGFEGLNDIIRFNLGRLRDHMDDPWEDYRLVHPRSAQIVSVPCARVYHLNIVLRVTTGADHRDRAGPRGDEPDRHPAGRAGG